MTAPDPYLRGHGDTRYRVKHYDLELAYKVSTNRLDEKARLQVEVLSETSRIDVDLRGLTASKAFINGKHAKLRAKATELSVDVGKRRPGDTFTLELHVSGKPRPVPGVHGDAGWEELTDGAMVGSQPQGAPGWFPCNNDAANKATYRIAVTTAAEYHVVANGTLASHERKGGSATWVYKMDYPMSPYLATVQIGKYTETILQSRERVSIVHPPRLRPGAGTAFEFQAQMVEFFSFLYGPYPFHEYRAVIVDDDLEIPLEAQGLSTFGKNFIAPTWHNERLVAHELAHQWFGNSVTSAQLHDMWLHEGFACYSEWLWAEKRGLSERPSANYLAAEHYVALPQLAEGDSLARPAMAHIFDDWVYKRGALALHALRAECGSELFFEIIRTWLAKHRGRTVTTEMFLELCHEKAGDSAVTVLKDWLYGRDLPQPPVNLSGRRSRAYTPPADPC